MDAGGDRALRASNIAVIKEIYDNEYSQQNFANQLERALDSGCTVIVIEPDKLGDETAAWIKVGNYLHKAAITTGVFSIASGLVSPYRYIPHVPLCVFSTVCTVLYTVSWQFDACVNYQVERNPNNLSRLPQLNNAIATTTPVVLVRQENTRKVVFQWTVAVSAVTICAYRMYKIFN